ncbi:M1 family metallopeptidase [Actinocorallia longicatena]|uniref:Aminopeptidase N n=1 Tax=Actinocorallia longicatena TaxID=111803 RepID=A0ABP6Q2Z8_9ACTN
MTAPRLAAAALTATVVLVPVAAQAVTAPKFTPGSGGAGEPYFKDMGNGGYDVGHYGLKLAYNPSARSINATVKITAVARKNLSRFNLDLRGLTVTAVQVNGKAAKFTRSGAQELVITPRSGLPAGKKFTVAVAYNGVPKKIEDEPLGQSGWISTEDGAVALNQPFGTATWMPVNDTPKDKATYTFTLVVPKGLTALANGVFKGKKKTKDGRYSFKWSMTTPMASELSLVAIGKYRVKVVKGKLPSYTAFDSDLAGSTKLLTAYDKKTRSILKWESKLFGAYPFASTGGIVDELGVGYSLETQSLPVHDWSVGGQLPPDDLLVHELAHQWFGDSVTPARWKDIWLNEGFATYAEWLYTASRKGGKSVDKQFATAYAYGPGADVWKGVLADPGRDHIFDAPVYQRGAMTIHMIRKAVGDPVFFRMIKAWVHLNKNKNVTTQDFQNFCEKYSGKQLDGLFKKWVFTAGKPEL